MTENTFTFVIQTDPQDCILALTDCEAPKGVNVISDYKIKYSVDASDVLLAVATIAASVPANVLSNWLSEKLKSKKPNHVYINNDEVSLHETHVSAVIDKLLATERQKQAKHTTQKADS